MCDLPIAADFLEEGVIGGTDVVWFENDLRREKEMMNYTEVAI